MKKYECPRCHGKFTIPPNVVVIEHICPVTGKRYKIPVAELKQDD